VASSFALGQPDMGERRIREQAVRDQCRHLQPIIHAYVTAVVNFDAGRREADSRGVGDAPDGNENIAGIDHLLRDVIRDLQEPSPLEQAA
jgi:hypothetical protein